VILLSRGMGRQLHHRGSLAAAAQPECGRAARRTTTPLSTESSRCRGPLQLMNSRTASFPGCGFPDLPGFPAGGPRLR